jgi:hypothetical protein
MIEKGGGNPSSLGGSNLSIGSAVVVSLIPIIQGDVGTAFPPP